MKNGLREEVEIPQDVEVSIKNNEVEMKKGDKEVKKKFYNVIVEKKENKIIVRTKRKTKREVRLIKTVIAHLKNLFRGVGEGFKYKLQICSVHFPMTVNIQDKEVIVKNFLGETSERKTKILPNVEVKVDKDIIIINSSDKEAAGQTAANIEKIAQVRNKDKRIFQDGIFMIEKAGKEI